MPAAAPVPAGTVLDAPLVADARQSSRPAWSRSPTWPSNRVTHQVVGQVLPGLLVVFAVVLLAFGLPKLRRRPAPASGAARRPSPPPPARPDRSASSAARTDWPTRRSGD